MENYGDKLSHLWITKMFIGEYIYSIDDKKRLAIPKSFRPSLGKKAVITRGLDYSLVLYPLGEWEKVARKLESLPNSQTDARGFTRIMLSGAVEVQLDKLGRILIPDYLKEYAFLKKNLTIIGLSNKIEVWAKERWDEYKQKMEKEVVNVAERLGEKGV